MVTKRAILQAPVALMAPGCYRSPVSFNRFGSIPDFDADLLLAKLEMSLNVAFLSCYSIMAKNHYIGVSMDILPNTTGIPANLPSGSGSALIDMPYVLDLLGQSALSPSQKSVDLDSADLKSTADSQRVLDIKPKRLERSPRNPRVDPMTGKRSTEANAIPRSTFAGRQRVDPMTGERSDKKNAILRSTFLGRQKVDPKTGRPSSGPTAVSKSRFYRRDGAIRAKRSREPNAQPGPNGQRSPTTRIKKSTQSDMFLYSPTTPDTRKS